MEIRIWSVSQDNSQSSVRTSHESKKFVIDLNYNNKEVLADLFEEQASQPIVKVSAARREQNHKEENSLICRTSFR